MARRAFVFACLAVFTLASLGCNDSNNGSDLVRLQGDTTLVDGKRVTAWTDTDLVGIVKRVGVTMDANLVTNPPAAPGSGPLGAVAVLSFPDAARNTSIFNHFEMHWNTNGHEPEIYEHPHYDLHFYSISEAQVRAIAPPDSVAPDANRVPAGYAYPGVNAAVPQMGVHASPASDFVPGYHFEKTMILGYWGGSMIFVEPMITQAWLATKTNWSMAMPVPDVIGRGTLYPTRFDATYDGNTNQWHFVYSEFVAKS